MMGGADARPHVIFRGGRRDSVHAGWAIRLA